MARSSTTFTKGHKKVGGRELGTKNLHSSMLDTLMRYVDKNDDLFKDVMSEYKFLGGRKFLRQAFKEDPKFLVSAINAYLRNGLSATGNSKLSDAIAKTGGHMVINKVYYGK